MTNTNSHNGFNYAIVGVLLILNFFIFSYLINRIQYTFEINPSISSTVIGILIIAIGLISIIGFIKSLKGIKEPNTLKKIIGIIINFGIILLFLSVIITSFYDIYQAFNNLN